MSENQINYNEYIENNCFMITQYNFMNQVDFDNDNTFELKMTHSLKRILIEIKFKSLIFDVPYLNNNEVRKKKLNDFIQREDNKKIYNLISFNLGINNEYFIISKVSENNFFQTHDIELIETLNEKFKLVKIKLIKDRIREQNEDENEKKELEEILEEMEREREVIKMPQIKKIESIQIENNIVKVIFKGINKEKIINKNSLIKNFEENYGKYEIEYKIYLIEIGKTDFFTISNYEKDNLGNIIFIFDKLDENKLYGFKISIKFERFYSEPNNIFYFFIPIQNPNRTLIFYSNEKTDIFPFENENNIENKIKKPILFKEKVLDSSYCTNTLLTLMKNGKVFISGNSYVKENEKEKGVFTTFEIEEDNNPNIKLGCIKYNDFDLNTQIKKISLGYNFGLLLDIYGKLYSFGDNKYGQLGLGLNPNQILGNPLQIKFNDNIFFYDIVCTYNGCLGLGLKNNNKVLYIWGNFSEQINYMKKIPEKINFVNSDNIIKIFGKCNSLGILCYDNKNDINKFYVYGSNFYFKLGFDFYRKDFFDEFELVDFFYDKKISVLNVSFDDNYTVVLGINKDKEKEVYYCGKPEFLKSVNMWTKIEKNWFNEIICFFSSSKKINFLLSNGCLKSINGDEEEDIQLIDEKNIELLNNNNQNFEIKIEGDDDYQILLI